MQKFINKDIFRNPLFYSSMTVIGILILSYLVCKPFYATNDDVIMKMIASGKNFAFQSPNEHLIYINILYGKTLKFLYTNFPSCQWYDIFFLTLTTISSFAIIHSLIRLIENTPLKIFVALSLLFTLPLFFINVQFTQIASFLAMGAVLAFISLMLKRPKNNFFVITGILYVFFAVVFSTMVRFESTLMILIYSFIPINMIIFYNKRNNKIKTFLLIILFYICSFVLLTAFAYINFYLYSIDKDWKDHYSYNTERVKLIEFNNYLNYGETYRKQLKKEASGKLKIPNNLLRQKLMENYSKKIYSSDLNALFVDGTTMDPSIILRHLSKYKNYVTVDEIKQELIDDNKNKLNNAAQYDLNYMYLTMEKENDLKDKLAKVGWTKNDYQFLIDVYAVQNKRFSLENFKTVNKILYTPEYKKEKFKTIYKELNKFFDENPNIIITEVLILLIFSSMFFEKKRFSFSISIIIQYLGFLLFILLTSKYPPYRVFISLFLFNFYYILLFIINSQGKINLKEKMSLLNLILPIFFVFILFLAPTIKLAHKREKMAEEYQKTLQYYINVLNQGKTIVAFGACFVYEQANSPFQRLEDYSKKIEGFSWMSYTQNATKYYINKYHTLDFLPQLCGSDSYIVANDMVINSFKQYVKNLYNLDLTFNKVQESENIYTCKIIK